MAYRVRFAAKAKADIRQFAAYLADYSKATEERVMAELAESIVRYILPRPMSWPFYFLTGAPYRAYLFKVGRRTAYWIIFDIDDTAETINILRFWNSARDPESFEL